MVNNNLMMHSLHHGMKLLLTLLVHGQLKFKIKSMFLKLLQLLTLLQIFQKLFTLTANHLHTLHNSLKMLGSPIILDLFV